MTFVRDTSLSVRHNIMLHLEERFLGVVEGHNGHILRWNQVERDPVEKIQAVMPPTLGLHDTGEQKSPLTGGMQCVLTVATEFFGKAGYDEKANDLLNRYLAEVQRTMFADKTMGGLAVRTVEDRSEFDLNGVGNNLVGGVAFWQVTYQHKPDDPTKLIGE